MGQFAVLMLMATFLLVVDSRSQAMIAIEEISRADGAALAESFITWCNSARLAAIGNPSLSGALTSISMSFPPGYTAPSSLHASVTAAGELVSWIDPSVALLPPTRLMAELSRLTGGDYTFGIAGAGQLVRAVGTVSLPVSVPDGALTYYVKVR